MGNIDSTRVYNRLSLEQRALVTRGNTVKEAPGAAHQVSTTDKAHFEENLVEAANTLTHPEDKVHVGQQNTSGEFVGVALNKQQVTELIKDMRQYAKDNKLPGVSLAPVQLTPIGNNQQSISFQPYFEGSIARNTTENDAGENLSYFTSPSLSHHTENFTSVETAQQSVEAFIQKIENPQELMQARLYDTVRLSMFHPEHGDLRQYVNNRGGELEIRGDFKTKVMALAEAQGLGLATQERIHLQEVPDDISNQALYDLYKDNLSATETRLRNIEGLPDNVRLQVTDQAEFDNVVFNQPDNTYLNILETDATGPAKGVNKYVKTIAEGYATLQNKPFQGDVGTVTSEQGVIQAFQDTWSHRPDEKGRSVVIINGHSGVSSTSQSTTDADAIGVKGIRLSEGTDTSKILSSAAIDYKEWEQAVKGAKPGDCIVINSCDGATHDKELRSYANLVSQEFFPEGVFLVISNGKAQADIQSADGYVVLSKPVKK